MNKTFVTLLKFGFSLAVSLAILGYLIHSASSNDSFADLQSRPKDWVLLTLAALVAVSAVTLTFVRWYVLVRALELPFTIWDGLRLGFMGFLFNFLPGGIMTGDTLKTVFVCREQKGRRTEAVTTVVMDRLVGLYTLFFVAGLAYLLVDFDSAQMRGAPEMATVRWLGNVALGLTAAGTLAGIVLMLPGFTTGSWWELIIGLPRVGPQFERIREAARMYRQRRLILFTAVVMGITVHTMTALATCMVARGLFDEAPTAFTHIMIVPLATAANIVPLPGGLGAFEGMLDFLYKGVSSTTMAESQGLVVALGYRVITIGVAVIGAIYYFIGRKEVKELLQEAEEEKNLSATQT